MAGGRLRGVRAGGRAGGWGQLEATTGQRSPRRLLVVFAAAGRRGRGWRRTSSSKMRAAGGAAEHS